MGHKMYVSWELNVGVCRNRILKIEQEIGNERHAREPTNQSLSSEVLR